MHVWGRGMKLCVKGNSVLVNIFHNEMFFLGKLLEKEFLTFFSLLLYQRNVTLHCDVELWCAGAVAK